MHDLTATGHAAGRPSRDFDFRGDPKGADDSLRTVRDSIGILLGVNALWLPLSMLFNSLQSLVLPVFVLHFVGSARKGTVLGLLLFVGLSAGAIIQPLAGRFSDQLTWSRTVPLLGRGRRRPLIIAGTALTLLSLAGFASAPNLVLLALAYLAVSLSASITQAGFQGLMPDVIPSWRRGRASGLKGLLELLGSVLGFSIAGLLIKKGHPAAVLTAIGLLLVSGTLLSLHLVREDGPSHSHPGDGRDIEESPSAGPASVIARVASHRRHQAPHGLRSLNMQSAITHVLISRFFFLLGVYGIGHFLLFFVRDRLHASGSPALTGLLLTLFTLQTAIVALGGGVLSDRMGRLPVLWGGVVLSAVGSLLLAPASTIALIVIGGSIMSLGSGLFASANWALTADLTPRGAGGQYFGMAALATGGAAALAGLFGPVVDHAGYAPLFLIAATSFVLSGVVLPRVERVERAMRLAAANA